MGSSRTHNFWINSQDVEWHWLAFNGNDVAKYSGYLARQVKEDRRSASSRVQLCDGVSEDALKVVISAIPGKHVEGDVPAFCINERDPESGFDDLLSLAIACWKYDCAIPPAGKKFANDFYGNWTIWYGHGFYDGAAGREIRKAINWMFIALVFEWDRIFTNTSRVVVSKYITKDDNPNLPKDFQDLVAQTRKRKMQQTYSFVQKSWMSFYEPPMNELLNKIQAHFLYKLGLELQNSIPKNTYKQINPDTLLIELAEVVKANEVQDPRLLSPPLVFDAPIDVPGPQTHGTGRSGLFGPAAVSIGRDILHAARRAMRPRVHEARHSSSSSSSGQSWKKMQSLEKLIDDFRTHSLDGIMLLDEDYTKLREVHIIKLREAHNMPTVSGIQPKIKQH